MYQVSLQAVAELFAQINDEVFDGTLPEPEFEIDTDPESATWGYCLEDGGVMVLGMLYEFPNYEHFEAVLCHEMIHLWQWILYRSGGHGETFEEIIPHFEANGYEVSFAGSHEYA